jgi:mRNA m6A methyltransferase non-catalytic subunit
MIRYPKQRRLLQLKKAAVASCASTPYILPFSQHQSLLGAKFDAIVLDPPYGPRFGWDDLSALPVPQLAAEPSFVFLWVGSGAGEGLERGREVLAKWGYRRCEDVVWVKTNRTGNQGPGVSVFHEEDGKGLIGEHVDGSTNDIAPREDEATLSCWYPGHG